MRLFGDLGTGFSKKLKHHVTVTIKTFAFPRGSKSKEKQIVDIISYWLGENIETLPMGRSDHQLTEVPFSISVFKDDTDSPGLIVSRWVPPNIDPASSIKKALNHKYKALSHHKAIHGAITVLILESNDISLTNHIHLYKAFLKAYRRVAIPKVDQIWLARTYDPEHLCDLYCFHGPQTICDNANPVGLMFGAHHSEYWDAVTGFKRM